MIEGVLSIGWLTITGIALAVLLLKYFKETGSIGTETRTQSLGIGIALVMLVTPAIAIILLALEAPQRLSEVILICGTASMLLGIIGGCPFIGRAVYRAVYRKMEKKR